MRTRLSSNQIKLSLTVVFVVAIFFSAYLTYAVPLSSDVPAGTPSASDIDIVLVKTGIPIYKKPKRRLHTAPPDFKERPHFQFTSTFDNTDSVPHKVFFYTECTAEKGSTVQIANMYLIHNLSPGKKRVKHILPINDDQRSFVEELKISMAPINCVFTIEGYNDQSVDSTTKFIDSVPDSDSSNNVLNFTMAFGRNGRLKIR